MMKVKERSLLLGVVVIVMALVIGLMADIMMAFGAISTKQLLNDDKGLTLNDDVWIEQGEGGIETAGDVGYLKVNASLDHRFVFMKDAIEVAADEDLVFEYDLLAYENLNADGSVNGSAWVGQYGPLKGLDTSEAETFTAEYVSEMIYSHKNNYQRGYIGYEQYRAAITALRPNYFGGADSIVETVDGTSGGAIKDGDFAWKFYAEDGTTPYTPGGANGFGLAGFRYIFNYKKDGSMVLKKKAILEDGYGAEAFVLGSRSGTFLNRSGQIGFYVQGVGASVELIFDNIKVSTVKDGTAAVKYEDNFTNGIGKWKMNTTPAPKKTEMLSEAPKFVTFNDPTEDNYLVANASKAIVFDKIVGGKYVEIETAISIESLKGDRKAGFVFNLETSGDTYKTKDAIMLGFKKVDDNIKLEVTKGTDSAAEVVGAAQNVSEDLSESTDIKIYGLCNETIEVVIGTSSYVFGDNDNKIVIAKRMSIVATGEKKADNEAKFNIFKMLISNKTSYVSNSAKDVYMDFDGVDEEGKAWLNEENFRLFSQPGEIAPADNATEGVYLKDGQLVFDSAGHNSYFTPRNKYTDFEMIFDVTDMARKVEKNSAGKVTRTVNNGSIIIGLNLANATSNYSDNYFIQFYSPLTKAFNDADYAEGVANVNLNTFISAGGMITNADSSLKMRHNFLDPKYDGKTFRIRVTTKNDVISVYYCLVGEESYDMMEVPVYMGRSNTGFFGYVGLTTTSFPGKMAGSFTVDNYILRNIDTMNIFETENAPEPEPEPEPEPKPEPGSDEPSGCGSVGGLSSLMLFILAGAGAALGLKKR